VLKLLMASHDRDSHQGMVNDLAELLVVSPAAMWIYTCSHFASFMLI